MAALVYHSLCCPRKLQIGSTEVWTCSVRSTDESPVQQPDNIIIFVPSTDTDNDPIGIDDISGKAQETWEEMVIDLYNNTPHGTRSYQIEKFSGMPVLTSNWRVGGSQQRAYTRLIPLQFFEHSDEPDATYQYTKLDQARRKVSKSVAKIIQICSTFCSEERERNDEIFPQVSQIFCICIVCSVHHIT